MRVPAEATVLDLATGTGAVALELVQRYGCRVVGIDQSYEMLEEARARIDRAGLASQIELLHGRAEELPFRDGRFTAATFTYLLRYVEEPLAAMREVARVVRPGGTVGSLEFGVPSSAVTRAAWNAYTRIGLPALGRLISPGWHEVGRFLNPSIRVSPSVGRSSDRSSSGAARVSSMSRPGRSPSVEAWSCGRAVTADELPRPSFYALAPGGWRDYVTLLHLPYTAWHLSYVVIGAALAPVLHADRLGATLLAFFLAVGIGAHALDELNGRPLQTRIPARLLVGLAAASIAAAVGIGAAAAVTVTAWLGLFVGFGAFIVVAYNLELVGGWFHRNLWFALAGEAFRYSAAILRSPRRSGPRPCWRRSSPPALACSTAALDAGPPRQAPHREGRGGARAPRRRMRADHCRDTPRSGRACTRTLGCVGGGSGLRTRDREGHVMDEAPSPPAPEIVSPAPHQVSFGNVVVRVPKGTRFVRLLIDGKIAAVQPRPSGVSRFGSACRLAT